MGLGYSSQKLAVSWGAAPPRLLLLVLAWFRGVLEGGVVSVTRVGAKLRRSGGMPGSMRRGAGAKCAERRGFGSRASGSGRGWPAPANGKPCALQLRSSTGPARFARLRHRSLRTFARRACRSRGHAHRSACGSSVPEPRRPAASSRDSAGPSDMLASCATRVLRSVSTRSRHPTRPGCATTSSLAGECWGRGFGCASAQLVVLLMR